MSETVDFEKLKIQLELQEIESPGGIATAQVYGQLLGIYLLQNDLPNAKFLWKRIPTAVKTSNPDLADIWAVGQKMWVRDFPGIYEALNKDWPEATKPVMEAVLECTRQRGIQLVGQAYSSISADQLAQILGIPANEAIEGVIAQGWSADPQTKMVTPVKPVRTQDMIIPSEQQMARLTDFVSFLEN